MLHHSAPQSLPQESLGIQSLPIRAHDPSHPQIPWSKYIERVISEILFVYIYIHSCIHVYTHRYDIVKYCICIYIYTYVLTLQDLPKSGLWVSHTMPLRKMTPVHLPDRFAVSVHTDTVLQNVGEVVVTCRLGRTWSDLYLTPREFLKIYQDGSFLTYEMTIWLGNHHPFTSNLASSLPGFQRKLRTPGRIVDEKMTRTGRFFWDDIWIIWICDK